MGEPVDETRGLVESSWSSFAADDAERKVREAERRGAPETESPYRVPRTDEERLTGRVQRVMELFFGHGPLPALGILLAIVLLVFGFIALGGDGDGGDTTATGPAATTASDGPEVSTAAGGPAAVTDASGECLLPGVLEVTSTQTDEYEGDRATQYRGEVTITNTSDDEVRLALFHSFSTGGPADEWSDGESLAPGATTTVDVTAQGFEDGTETWDVVTAVAAYDPSTDCSPLGRAELDAFGDAAVLVTNPLPVGP